MSKETQEFKFVSPYPHKRYQQTFDPKEKVKMAGKEYVWDDMIQEAREDTEIYPTLEKYGCIEKMPMDANKIYADFSEYKDLRTMKDQQIKAQEMWLDLPWEVRAKFDNNIHNFIENGEKYVKDIIDNTAKPEEIKPKEEGVTNNE